MAPVHPATRAASLAHLAARIEAVERRWCAAPSAAVETDLPAPLDRLACGVIHEWLCPPELAGCSWAGPLLLFTHLVRRRVMGDGSSRVDGLVLWIGRRLWPQPWLLRDPVRNGAPGWDDDLLRRSVLVDPPTDADRLWAIDLALRSPGVSSVVADGSGLRHTHSRRLQLAAESGGALALLARPERERSIPSAAAARWVVSPTTPGRRVNGPAWRVERVRCKGVQRRSGMEAADSLVLEHDHASGCFRASTELAHRPCDQADHCARQTA